jgi:hypothetical protein
LSTADAGGQIATDQIARYVTTAAAPEGNLNTGIGKRKPFTTYIHCVPFAATAAN